jgi:excisionase family DNA binding protein
MTDNSRDPSVTALLTLTEAAAVLRTPVATLRYWRHLGIGPAGFRLGRRVLYRRDDLDRWVEAQRTAQVVDPPQS